MLLRNVRRQHTREPTSVEPRRRGNKGGPKRDTTEKRGRAHSKSVDSRFEESGRGSRNSTTPARICSQGGGQNQRLLFDFKETRNPVSQNPVFYFLNAPRRCTGLHRGLASIGPLSCSRKNLLNVPHNLVYIKSVSHTFVY